MKAPRAPGIALAVLGALGAFASGCAADGPVSGQYCSQADPAKCATISFPPRRGTEAPGTIQIDGRRYELSWMDSDGPRRKYLANPPSGTIAFDLVAVTWKSVVLKWRDNRPEDTYVLR